MALHVHHGPQLAPLAAGLVRRLAAPGGDPFEALVVAVPTAGVRDWLTRRLAGDLGIAANIDMPFPGRFFADAIGLDETTIRGTSSALTWAVLDVLEPGCRRRARLDGRRARTARSPAGSPSPGRSPTSSTATPRPGPEILRQWQRGVRGDGTMRAAGVGGVNGAGRRAARRWPAGVDGVAVRAVAARAPSGSAAPLRPNCWPNASGSCGAATSAGACPPASSCSVSAPCRARNSTCSPPSVASATCTSRCSIRRRSPGASTRRSSPPTDGAQPARRRPRHRRRQPPAAAARGDARAARRRRSCAACRRRSPSWRRADESPAAPSTLLEHLRADLAADRPPTPFARSTVDASIQVHACHGTIRQLEVLRDVLGHLFVADPSLRPDDVLVICPDLDRFEPFAAAVFGRGTLPVPVTVSDLSLGTENPIAAALATILHTVAGRCTASEVLAVAALDAVRRRIGDRRRRPRPVRPVERAARHDVGGSTAPTGERGSTPTSPSAPGNRHCGRCSSGRRCRRRTPRRCSAASCRSTTSAATTSPRPVGSPSSSPGCARSAAWPTDGGRSPSGATSSSTSSPSCALRRRPSGGRRASVLEAIDDGAPIVAGRRSAEHLAAGVRRRARRRRRHRRRPPRAAAPAHGRRGAHRQRPGAQRPGQGRVPARLRRGEPAPAGIDGDDLLAVRPCVGERDRHAERRHLLLDALLAAEQTLVVTCDGSDVTTNRETRFAVQLSELLDVVDATLEPASAQRRRSAHLAGAHAAPVAGLRRAQLRPRRPPPASSSFDDVMCARRRGAPAPRRRPPSASVVGRWSRSTSPCPESVTLRQLVDACVRPALTLLHEGLGVRLPGEVERVDHDIPLSVDRTAAGVRRPRLLERYGRTRRALRVDGGTADAWEAAARAAVAEWSAAERLAARRRRDG